MQYRPDIDGLRAIAVLAVVFHHLLPSAVPGGYIGVDIFFVISGYLITGIISREASEGRFSFVNFYERRVRRLFPALFTMLAVILVFGYFLLLPSDFRSTLRAALGTIFFSSNIVFWKSMAEGYFAADAKLNPLLHTWSLSVEEQFYLLFPLLLMLCYRFCRRSVVLVMFICAAVSLVLADAWVRSHAVATFFLSPFRAWELLVGGLLSLNAVPALRSRPLREGLAAAALLAIVGAIFWFDTRTGLPGYAALLPVLGATAILHVGTSGGSAISRALVLKPVVYVGLISYSLYLWHWPLIVLTRFGIGMDTVDTYVPALLVGSLVLGSLSYHVIEQPFRSRDRVGRRAVFGYGATASSVLVAVAAIGMINRGNESRFSNDVLALDLARYPSIPFVECDSRKDGCKLGPKGVPSTMLLWGDSHLLAWAPVFEQLLDANGVGALFRPTSACPPLFGAISLNNEACYAQNLAISTILEADSSVRTVVLAADWKAYFQGDIPLRVIGSSAGQSGTTEALRRTIRWLLDHGKEVYVIGPVPTYDRDVPLTLALQRVHQRDWAPPLYEKRRRTQTAFFGAIRSLNDAKLHVVDPEDWMCKPACVVEIQGKPLYRDGNHLSVAGAMFGQSALAVAMSAALGKRNAASVSGTTAAGDIK